MATYRVSPAWRISAVGDGFEIHGGDDARYEVDSSWVAAQLAADRAVARDEVPAAEAGQFEQLRAAGIIGPVLDRRTGRVRLFGDPLPPRVLAQLTCDVTEGARPTWSSSSGIDQPIVASSIRSSNSNRSTSTPTSRSTTRSPSVPW